MSDAIYKLWQYQQSVKTYRKKVKFSSNNKNKEKQWDNILLCDFGWVTDTFYTLFFEI